MSIRPLLFTSSWHVKSGEYADSDDAEASPHQLIDVCSCSQLNRTFGQAGIAHGDVRPDNVLRGVDGRLRFIDFETTRLVPKVPLEQ